MNGLQGYWMWLGPVLAESEVLRRPAVSTAATRWQRGLVDALSAFADIQAMVLRPEPLWPRGPAIVRAKDVEVAPGATPVGYVNVPGLRSSTQARMLLTAVDELSRRRGPPRVVVSYNVNAAVSAVAAECARRWGTKWYPIIADLPSREAERVRLQRRLRNCSGVICLSWAVFERERALRPAHHLDGGVTRLPGGKEPPFEYGSILYTGALSEYGGIDTLLEAFQRVEAPAAQLWICGKGRSGTVERARARDPRISVFGVVSEDRLASITASAAVLANPRPPRLQASEDNFPSKVLEYLSYGKPVVSTWTPGLKPEYRQHLIVAESGSVDHYAAALNTALALGPDVRAEMRTRVRGFLQSEKLWSVQAARLVEWVERGANT